MIVVSVPKDACLYYISWLKNREQWQSYDTIILVKTSGFYLTS